jgi:hypothetical protein
MTEQKDLVQLQVHGKGYQLSEKNVKFQVKKISLPELNAKVSKQLITKKAKEVILFEETNVCISG